jgi:hypothetical protein
MSLDRRNKLRIPFVQGKFNFGGTGALMFCGRRKLQLLITRRDPELLAGMDKRGKHWSLTVVRRESPPEGPGQVRNPYFKYLAPVGADDTPGKGEVLSFDSESMVLMPEGNSAYARQIEWGSCIKLYEYDMRGFKGHILRRDGLLARLEIILPEVALPVRLHECRAGLRGHPGSFDTNLLGLKERLEESRSDSLEPGYPTSLTLSVRGQQMTAKVYAFKWDKADSYRVDQGVVFTVSGQSHGWFPKTFFERKKVGMARLAKALLVVVDCSSFSVEARADFFKNSRDRLSGGDFRKEIEEELESQIAAHPGLRKLREERRQNEVAERLQDSKPLENIINEVLKSSPSLSKLFLLGQRLSRPYHHGVDGQGGPNGSENGDGQFKGKAHPTFFRFEKLDEGQLLSRQSEIGRRCRIKFVTDAENEYFVRDNYPGKYFVEVVDGPLEGLELTNSVSLHNGVANWAISIPTEQVETGTQLTLEFTVVDETMIDPIVNVAKVTLVPRTERPGGPGGPKDRNGGHEDDEDNGSRKAGSGNESMKGLDLPKIKKVREAGWPEFGFDQNSACTFIDDGESEETGGPSLTFYINVENICLQNDMKNTKGDPLLIESKFVYGNVLVGLALIHGKTETIPESSDDAQPESLSKGVERVTRALAPFLVPMIDYLGGLQEEDTARLGATGDEE